MKSLPKIVGLFIGLLLAAGGAQAQGVGASGDIRGAVTDPTGAAVPNATINVTETAKGLRRTVASDDTGQYQVTGLPPAFYDVSAQAPGFKTEIKKGLVLNIGQTGIIDFQMQLSTASESIEITAEEPVVDLEKGHQANVLTEQYIRDLPINRRDYLTFALLTPGVSDSTRMADNSDFRVKQTPQSGLSLYGSNGRGNSVTVDGGDANDNAGGVRLTMSQDAVQEFQVNRSNYAAELGSASGASINIVSKSGSNDWHGSLYSFFRNDIFDARDPFAFTQALTPSSTFSTTARGFPTKDSLQREQFGVTIGLPIKRDKTFLFAAFEGLLRDEQHSVPLLTDTSIFNPTSAQNAIIASLSNNPDPTPIACLNRSGTIVSLPARRCAGALQSALTVSPATGLAPINTAINNYVINQLETNGGLFPFNERQYLASARLDHIFNDGNQAVVRFTYGHDRSEDPDVQALTGFTRGSRVISHDSTLQGAWFHQFSPRTQNEARLQANYNYLGVESNQPAGPGLDIPGYATLGGGIFLPSFTIGRRGEIADNLTMIRGRHTMKMGFLELLRSEHDESHTFFPGRFVFGSLNGGLLSPQLLSTSLTSLQTVSLGAPQFYQQGFDNPSYPTGLNPWTAVYWQDSWRIWPGLTFNYGLRYEVDQRYQLNTDKDNFAPRVSFAWDPFKDHKTVVRGGYGIFYAPTYGQIDNVARTLGVVDSKGQQVRDLSTCNSTTTDCFRQIAQVFVPLSGAPGNPSLTSAAIFQSLFSKISNCPIGGSQRQPNCITPPDLTRIVTATGIQSIPITHNGRIPALSVVFSGAPDYQNPMSQQAEIGIEREVAPGLSVSLSGIYVHTTRLPRAIDVNLLPGAPITPASASPNGIAFQNWGAPACSANPFLCFANPLLLQNNIYTSTAASIYTGGILEVKKRVSDHFTMMGNYTYSRAVDDTTDFNSDFEAFNQTRLSDERALSAFDQRHKVVAAGVFDSPWTGMILRGFQFSPIFRYNSSRPFNLLAGTNVNNDRHSTNDRPPGAGRNTGVGPDFATFDMRLSRRFRITEKAALQLIAEGFNLFNRTNFASVNNTVGADFRPPFNVSGRRDLSPSQPLGFTSALPRRQFQFGLRLSF